MWDLIVSVPDHCLSFYSENITRIRSNVRLKIKRFVVKPTKPHK